MTKGKFIVLEGLDGSGQSTQVKLLADFLAQREKQFLITKEPTPNSEFGKKIRQALLGNEKINSKELQKLFVQDRKWHLENEIFPALAKGWIVVCDRYLFSTLSYGIADGLSEKDLLAMNSKFLLPDILFFLDTPPQVCVERIEKRGEGKQLFEKLEKLEKVYVAYKDILVKFGTKTQVFILDGKQLPEAIQQKIIKIIEKIL